MRFRKLPEKTTDLKNGIKLLYYKELTEDKAGPTETYVAVDERGNELVTITKKGDKYTSAYASSDAEESGLYKKVAKKVGLPEEDALYTTPILSMAQGAIKAKKDIKENKYSYQDPTGKDVKLLQKAEDGSKIKEAIKERSQKIANTMKLFSAIKGLRDKPRPMDGVEPPYIDDEFKAKLKNITKSDNEESPGLKALRERMKQPHRKKPGSRDEKIKAALERQQGGGVPSSDSDRESKIRTSLDKINSKMKEMKTSLRSAKEPEKEISMADRVRARLPEGSRVAALFERLNTEGHHEPYAGGDFHNILHRQKTKDQGLWNEPAPIPVFGKVDPKGHLGKEVHKGGPDPFAWVDSKYGRSKDVLREHQGKPLTISTRSDLIGHDDYMEHIDPKNHKVKIHIMGDNDRINRIIEPGAPSANRRIDAAKKLKDAGIDVELVLDKIPGIKPEHNNSWSFQKQGFKVSENPVWLGAKAKSNIRKALGYDYFGEKNPFKEDKTPVVEGDNLKPRSTQSSKLKEMDDQARQSDEPKRPNLRLVKSNKLIGLFGAARGSKLSKTGGIGLDSGRVSQFNAFGRGSQAAPPPPPPPPSTSGQGGSGMGLDPGKVARFNPFGKSEEIPAKALDLTKKTGGSTISLKHGDLSGADMHVVSPYLERSELIKEDLNPEHIKKFMSKNKDLLNKEDHALGTWYDPEEKAHFLDIVKTVKDREEAKELGKRYNQKAIYHLKTGEVIPTGGTGKVD